MPVCNVGMSNEKMMMLKIDNNKHWKNVYECENVKKISTLILFCVVYFSMRFLSFIFRKLFRWFYGMKIQLKIIFHEREKKIFFFF